MHNVRQLVAIALVVLIAYALLKPRGEVPFYIPRDRPGAAATAHKPTCGPANVSLSKLRTVTEHRYVTLTGLVRHNCLTAVGVQLKWTAYNPDGSIAFTDNFWPASVLNIQANTDYPFEKINPAPPGNWKYTVEAVGIDHW